MHERSDPESADGIRSVMAAILAKNAGAEDIQRAVMADFENYLKARLELARAEATVATAEAKAAGIRDAVRRFCVHPKTRHWFSHYQPAPADTADECVVCGELLNFKKAPDMGW